MGTSQLAAGAPRYTYGTAAGRPVDGLRTDKEPDFMEYWPAGLPKPPLDLVYLRDQCRQPAGCHL